MAENVGEGTGTVVEQKPVELPALPENWFSGLDAELQKEESLKLFKDIPSLAKSLVTAQKMVGADKIVVPNPKYATDEDYQKVYKKLGLPEKIEEYNVEVPKTLGFEGDRLKAFKETAYKAGILPKQLQTLLQFHEADTKQVLDASEQKVKQDLESAKQELKNEYGMAHDKKLAQAQLAIKTLGDEKLVKFLDDSQLGNHPQMVRVFAKLGEVLGEKKVEGQGDEIGRFGSVKTPEVARREIAAVQGNLQHPYNDAKHPGHYMAVKDMEALFSQAYPHTEQSGT